MKQVLANVVTLEDEFRVTLVLDGDTFVIFVPRITQRSTEPKAKQSRLRQGRVDRIA